MEFACNRNPSPNAENYWVDPIFSPASPPGQVTGVSATAGNASASVAWSAPSTGGPATSYIVTPYIGSSAQTPTTVTGSPAPTNATIKGLTNGTAYTFTVTATNPNGSGPPSGQSNSVTPSSAISVPTFVQQATGHTDATSLALTPSSNVASGNRLVVLVGVWSGSGATAASVTDSAGNTYVELLHFKAADGTEMSVWSAPITAGGGTRPTVTVKPTSTADIGAAVSEYSGLSSATDASVLDETAHATGTTSAAATVASGATPGTTASGELALGMYVDSGFGDALTPGSGYTQRSNISGASDMDVLTEDQTLSGAGATPNATVGTGPSTVWLMATVVLKTGAATAPTVPAAPTNVSATAGNGTATVSWTAPTNGGSSDHRLHHHPIHRRNSTNADDDHRQPARHQHDHHRPHQRRPLHLHRKGHQHGRHRHRINPLATQSPPRPRPSPQRRRTSARPRVTAPRRSAGPRPRTAAARSPATPITPYIGGTAQTPMTITGNPPATSTTITGLTNGTAYTFTVKATNTVGTATRINPLELRHAHRPDRPRSADERQRDRG